MARIAIHGFGRIGRSLMRVALKDSLFVPVSISDIKDVPTLAALFEVDSNYGRWPEEVTTKDSGFVIGGREIPYFDSMKALPDWKALGVDLVIDCTGRATTRAGAQAHLDAGAKRVLVSAPSKTREDCDAVLLPGINLDTFDSGATQDRQHGELHDQRAGAGGQGRDRELRHQVRPVLDDPCLHQYAGADRPADEGSARLVGRGREHHPLVVGRGTRARLHLEGPQHHRQGLPRPHAHRQHRRAEPAHRASGDGRAGQRRVPQGGRAFHR